MAPANKPETDRLGRECRRLKLNKNIGRPDRSPLADLKPRRLRTMAIMLSSPIVAPWSRSAQIDRLIEIETPDLRLSSSRMTLTYRKMSVLN